MRDGWIETTLDGIAHYINGYPFKPVDLGENGLPVIRIKQLLDENEPVDRTETEIPDKYLLKNGDIVFSWSGTLAVKIWNRGPAKLNQHLFRVVEKEGVVKRIIPLIIEHAIEELEEKSHGTTMKHITKQTLLPHKVLLPPLPEQKRIVDLISSVDSYIESLEKLLKCVNDLRDSLHSDIFNNNSEKFREIKLLDFCEFINGKAHEKIITEDGQFIVINSKFIATNAGVFKTANEQLCAAIEGDITMVMSDLPNGRALAKCFLVDESNKFTVNQRICILRPKFKNSEYLKLVLNRNKYFLGFDDGVNQTNLSKRVFENCIIKIHSSTSIQNQIVDLFNEITRLQESLTQNLLQSKHFRNSLLEKLLSGEHEIPASYDKVMSVA